MVATPWGRKYHRNIKVEKRFTRWGFATNAIFIASMVIGFIGLFLKCPYMSDTSFHDFYFQKYLQTFLMMQYMSFWVIYNAFLPIHLKCFMMQLYEFMAGWHDIFKGRAVRNHGGNPDFDNNFYVNEI